MRHLRIMRGYGKIPPMKKLLTVFSVSIAVAAEACMTIIAGRKVSSTGRVIVAHNEDDPQPAVVRHGIVPAMDWPAGSVLPATKGCCASVPQAAHTLSFFWSEVKLPQGDGNADAMLNEKGVYVCSNSGGNSREDMKDPSLVAEGGVKFNLRRVVAERAASAREGARLVMDLVAKYGYAPSARIYTIADRDEAWMVQIVHGRLAAAVRCPDDQVTIMPNLYTFGDVFALPPDEVMLTPGLKERAIEKGWYRPGAKFDFAEVFQGSYHYGPEDAFEHPNNTGRFRQALRILLGREWTEKRFPFAVKPAKAKLTVDDLKSLMSSHNEPLVNRVHRLESWSICMGMTVESAVCEFTADPIDTVLHTALGAGCRNPYLPLRPFREKLPHSIDRSADVVERLATHVKAVPGFDLDFTLDLIRLRSESHDIPACNRATAFLKAYLEKHGVYCHVARTKEGRDAMYAATLPGKEHDYAFVTHIDVVPGRPDQFEPFIDGGEIYGRGACDTKVNAALIAQVLVRLAGKASVGAYFATDEDGCAGEVPTCTLLRREGFRPKKCVMVGDTAGDVTNTFFIAQKGHWGFRLKMPGKGGHSSIPWDLDNPVDKMARTYVKLMDALPKPADPAEHWYSSLSATVVKAGDVVNRIPDEAEMTFSYRYVGRDDAKNLKKLVRDVTGLEPVTDFNVPPVVNDPGNPEITGIIAAAQAFWPHRDFKVEKLNAATDAFQFSDLGLPIVIYCPDAHGAHQQDEHGSIASAWEYLDFLDGYLAGKGM